MTGSPPTPPLAPRNLDELPEHRREHLLWHFALELDYDGVEDWVLDAASRPCPWHGYDTRGEMAGTVAVLGDDGRYHLQVANDLVCVMSDRRHPARQFGHTQGCHWWTDGTIYRVNPPPIVAPITPAELSAGFARRAVRWTVGLTGTVTAPELVPRNERCPVGSELWPAHCTEGTPMGRLRIRLAAEFGRTCQGCGRAPADVIDHDHRTGLVRGVLCRNCNGRIDSCPHVAGCPWADYLNNPPAAGLKLRFPRSRKPSSSAHRARVEQLGFSMFD